MHNPELQQFLDDYHITNAGLARALGINRKAIYRWSQKKQLTPIQRLALKGLAYEDHPELHNSFME